MFGRYISSILEILKPDEVMSSGIFLLRLQPPAILFHIGLILFCHLTIFGSGASPCSQKSNLPLFFRTLVISEIDKVSKTADIFGRSPSYPF